MIYQGPRPAEAIALMWEDIKDDPLHGKYVQYQRTMSDSHLVDTTKDKEPRFNPSLPKQRNIYPRVGRHKVGCSQIVQAVHNKCTKASTLLGI